MKSLFIVVSLLLAAGTLSGYDFKTRDGKKVYPDYKGLGGPSQDARGIVIYYGEDYKKAIVFPNNFPADFPDKEALQKQLKKLPAAKKDAAANKSKRLAEAKAETAARKARADRLRKIAKDKTLIPDAKVKAKPAKSTTKRKIGENNNNNNSNSRSNRNK